MQDITITSEHFNTMLHGLNRAEGKIEFLKDSLENFKDYNEIVGNTLHLLLKAIETGEEFVVVSEGDIKSLNELGVFEGVV